MDTLGSRLLHIRKYVSKLNQKDFSELLDIPINSIGRYERNDMKPSADVIIQYLKKVNFNVEWLLTGEGDPLSGQIAPIELAQAQERIASLEQENTYQKQIINALQETVTAQKKTIDTKEKLDSQT